MRGPPVVLTNTLGRPVTNVISERGAVPMTVVNTLGEPVTLVNSGGEPVTLFNANGTLWDYPFSLFANNEQGAWYDPSDYSTLFQDSAGTTPVTAVEQPVRLMLDRSGRGNNATAPNDASRPVLRARYNLLTYSEQFNNAAWQKNDGSSVTANAVVAPDGTTTADQIDLSASELSRVQQALSGQPTASYTFTVWLRVASGSVSVRFGHSADIDVITITDTWQRFTSTKTVTSPSQPNLTIRNEAGGGAKTLYAWGADLKTAADQTATGGAYQRIAAATDYDTSNPVWRPYLAFDGSDDHMVLASAINITTDMTVVRGFGRSAAGINSLGFAHTAATPHAGTWNAGDNVMYGALGNAQGALGSASTATGFYVDVVSRNVTTESARRNGAALGSRSAATVSGSLSTVGRLNTLYNLGPVYGLILLDRELTGSELTATEQWMAGKTGATLA